MKERQKKKETLVKAFIIAFFLFLLTAGILFFSKQGFFFPKEQPLQEIQNPAPEQPTNLPALPPEITPPAPETQENQTTTGANPFENLPDYGSGFNKKTERENQYYNPQPEPNPDENGGTQEPPKTAPSQECVDNCIESGKTREQCTI